MIGGSSGAVKCLGVRTFKQYGVNTYIVDLLWSEVVGVLRVQRPGIQSLFIKCVSCAKTPFAEMMMKYTGLPVVAALVGVRETSHRWAVTVSRFEARLGVDTKYSERPRGRGSNDKG